MKGSKKLLPIIIIVAVVAVGAYLFLNKGKGGIGGGIAQKASEVFTGSLQTAIEKGIPMKCTYKVEGNEYEGIIKGKAWRGKMKSADGKVGEVILKDNCMWSWSETEKDKGVKMCFEPTKGTAAGEETGSIWDQESFKTSDVEYKCIPAVVTDAQFVPPTDIKFMDLSQFGQQ